MKRFLGIPIPIIAIVLALVLVGGGVLAAFFWTKSVPSTVTILGGEVQAFTTEACDTPLTALAFSGIRPGETTTPVSFWIKNIGDDPAYCALAQSGLDIKLTLNHTTLGVVPADPARLKLLISTTYVNSATSNGLNENLTPSTVDHISVAAVNLDAYPASGVVKIDAELIGYSSKNGGSMQLLGLTRGVNGTTPAAHAFSGNTVYLQTVTPTYALAPAAKLQVTLTVTAGADIAKSTKSWQTILEAKDTPY